MTGKVWQLWGVAFPAAVTFASFALWFFGGVGNGFISAFRLSPAAVLPSSPPWPPEDAALRCLPPGYALAPVVKVTGSRQTYRGMENNMDFAAGAVTMPERPTEDAAGDLAEEVLAVCWDKSTMAEAYGFSDIAADHVCRFVRTIHAAFRPFAMSTGVARRPNFGYVF